MILSENVRVALSVVVLLATCVVVAYGITERSLQLSLVDSNCKEAQDQYYRARERAIGYQKLNPSNEDQQTREKREHADVCAQNLMAEAASRGYWLLLFSLIFTGAAAVAAWSTLQTMRDTAERELRAYIAIEPNFIVAFSADNIAGARFAMINCGQTPAKRVHHNATVRIFPYPLPPGAAVPWPTDHASPDAALQSGGTLTGTCSARVLFLPAEIDGVRDGSSRIYVYGTVFYEDIFGTSRWTRFGSTVAADADTMIKLTSSYEASDLSVRFEAASEFSDFI